MEEFIVLGLVPGTSIQIDFFMWLKVATLFTGMMTITYAHRRFSRRSYNYSPPASEHHIFVSTSHKEESSASV